MKPDEKIMRRELAFQAIISEREYQDRLGPERRERTGGTLEHEVGEYLVMAATYLRKAEDDWTLNAGSEKALHQIRKLAAICVHCMEEHGAPRREELIDCGNAGFFPADHNPQREARDDSWAV